MSIRQLLTIDEDVSRALAEDLHGLVDYTATLIPANTTCTALVKTNQSMVLCGMDWVRETINQFDTSIMLHTNHVDGDKLISGDILFELVGNARSLLTIERTVLNFIQTLSATATTTDLYVSTANNACVKIMDTRKTIPTVRYAQKYAVTVGGGHNQRVGLFDGVLIKENHIIANGGIANTLKTAFEIIPNNLTVQIEVETIAELVEALENKATLILLDNMPLDMIKTSVATKNQINQHAVLEISGNVDLSNIAAYAATGVERISIGGLTKNIQAIDLSMRFYQ